ncbi:dihydroorotate dehydrogenase [Friedmanniella endophytica]|uniref:Dihydroorotate dehydrogenase (quinone) n=1 Tax=Microlunatus kandeliicorticis TaxID=1759536 RepID=A0A7W3P6N0_9ACTN|nr:quinone-dependent dihydroorotate dehydrogenase [Microlunatus kandeliicorticis]MBA8795090.1 dihydroorotate dehydrogenase [Microlunatus kandeliicorticis]
MSLVGAGYTRLARPVLFRRHGGDAERVHEETLRLLELVASTPPGRKLLRVVGGAPAGPVTVAGIAFPGRVGVAAGLDKNGRAARAWGPLGFGFAELGTVTAQAQPGNDRPRLFRLPASRGIVNRMGFNNDGAAALAGRLDRLGVRRGNAALGLPLGISIGKTKVVPVEDAVPDYLAALDLVAPYADYLAVNVSSPNTPGLRGLQDRAALAGLLTALHTAPAAAGLPIFVKIAPDLTDAALDEVLAVCTDTGVAGLVATNTTLAREHVRYAELALAREAGGLSGAPLTRRAREVVGYLTAHTDLPVMGVGGVLTAADAAALFDAGAALVQLYTGFIYAGPGLVRAINQHARRRP